MPATWHVPRPFDVLSSWCAHRAGAQQLRTSASDHKDGTRACLRSPGPSVQMAIAEARVLTGLRPRIGTSIGSGAEIEGAVR